MKTLALVAIVAFTFLSADAQAGFRSGSDLLRDCETVSGQQSNRPFLDGYCMGYIIGSVDAYEVERHLRNKKPCVPRGAETSQVVDATISYLGSHPADRNKEAAFLVTAAVAAAWGCK